MNVDGLHHVTAITADVDANVDFYGRLLGLRLVWQGVNADDPEMRHVAYGDECGTPGSVVTFFDMPGIGPGRPGRGMVHRLLLRVADAQALDFWERRLAGAGVAADRVADRLLLSDPDGLALALVIDDGGDEPLVARAAEVDEQVAVRGMHGVRAYSPDPARSAPVLCDVLGMAPGGEGSWLARGERRHTRRARRQRLARRPAGRDQPERRHVRLCEACRSGRWNHCIPATMERAVGLQADGGLAAHVAVSPKTLHALPDEMGRVESGWVEPAAVALRAVLAAGDLSGRSVLVVGGGPIGQLSCRLARQYGAARVWLSEPSAERRSYAKASQADRAFDPTVDAADIERLKVDVVLQCSGSEPGIRSSVAAARPEGTVVVVGGGRAGLDPIAILIKELRVVGSFTYADEFAEVLALLADGALQVADLTSEITSIDAAAAAFERLRDASTMKILIAPNGS